MKFLTLPITKKKKRKTKRERDRERERERERGAKTTQCKTPENCH